MGGGVLFKQMRRAEEPEDLQGVSSRGDGRAGFRVPLPSWIGHSAGWRVEAEAKSRRARRDLRYAFS